MKNFYYTETKNLTAHEKDGMGIIEGYGAFYDNKDSYDDIITKGAFSESLQTNRSVKMLLNHNTSDIIGVWQELKEDQNGLIVKGLINLDTVKGRETYSLVKQGAMSGLSVGFMVKDRDYNDDIRYIKKADLYEVSFTAFPANEKAKIYDVKSDDIASIRDFERLMRNIGFSKKEAKTIASNGYKDLSRDDLDLSCDDCSEQLNQLYKSLTELNNVA